MLCWKRDREIIITSNPVTPVSPGIVEVVTLEDFKSHIKVDSDYEDVLIQTYLDAATRQAASYTRQVLGITEYVTTMKYFPPSVVMDVCPININSVVVNYFDVDNAPQVLPPTKYYIRKVIDDYITIEFKGNMPNVYDREDAIQIEYEAGFVDAPAGIKTAIMIQGAALYENRQSEVLASSTHLIANGFYSLPFPFKMLS